VTRPPPHPATAATPGSACEKSAFCVVPHQMHCAKRVGA
jgi:hypothetical protein